VTVTDDECRHGLANRECDACFPKARPETPVVTSTRASRSKAATLARSTAAEAASLDLAAQRVYHLTHIDNLAGILAAQAIRSDAEGASPSVDISSPHAREARRMITVDDEGHTVADYVPFFLSPTSAAWGSIRTGTIDPRLNGTPNPTEFVLLVTSLGAVGAEKSAPSELVVADRDATHPLARFATTRDSAERFFRTLNADLDSSQLLEAELLVANSVPFGLVSVVTVANDRSRNRVKELLRGTGFSTRVAIHPPWFSAEVI